MMQISLESHTSILEAMQPLSLAWNLPSLGQLILLPFHGAQSEPSQGPAQYGSTDGVCALSQTTEAGWEGKGRAM